MSEDKLKWAAFGLAIGIIGGGIGAAGANKWYPGVTRFETIQAQEIRIVNAAGETTVGLVPDRDGGGGLFIYNALGENVAVLGAHSGGGVLGINNNAGKQVAHLSAYLNGKGGSLGLYNEAGEEVASLDAYPDGGMLRLNNAAGERVAMLEAHAHKGGGGVLSMYNSGGFKAGRIAALLQALPNDSGLRLYNEAGEAVAVLEAHKGAGVVAIRNKDLRVLAIP